MVLPCEVLFWSTFSMADAAVGVPAGPCLPINIQQRFLECLPMYLPGTEL